MKILIITPSPPEYLGGLALFSKDLSLNLEKHNIEVDMLTSTLSKKGPIFGKIGKNCLIPEGFGITLFFHLDFDPVLGLMNLFERGGGNKI